MKRSWKKIQKIISEIEIKKKTKDYSLLTDLCEFKKKKNTPTQQR